MLASMLGGGGASGSAGATGGSGNFAQMLGQIASSPAMHQLAASPTLQNAVQPLLDGGSGCDSQSLETLYLRRCVPASSLHIFQDANLWPRRLTCRVCRGQGAGQMDFGALMNEMGSVLAQMMGGGAGGLLGAASGNPTAAPAAPAPVDVPARPRSTPLPTAQAGAAGAKAAPQHLCILCIARGCSWLRSTMRFSSLYSLISGRQTTACVQLRAGQQHEVDPAVERVVGEELPAEDAEQWLSTMRADAQVMQQQGAEQRPLSSSYTAGSLHPPSSSDRLF